jgi:hypothetical protein
VDTVPKVSPPKLKKKIKLCYTIILLVILYECETYKLKEKCRLRVFTNDAEEYILGPKRKEV